MSERTSGSRRLTTSRSYQALLNEVAALYTQTRSSVARMYWEIGKRIVEVEQQGAARVPYGKRLLPRLSVDLTTRCGLGFSVRNLQRMRKLYLARQIATAPSQLGWSHQAELLSLPTARLRQQLAARAQRQDLSSDELRALVQQARKRLAPRTPSNGKPAAPPQLLTPKRGTPGLFRIKDLGELRYVDLGFEAYRALSLAEGKRWQAGDLVRYDVDGMLARAAEAARPEALYTYEAQVERVVDGDTMWTLVHLTGSEWRREKLRLRGIDCPERGTPAGDAAKRFVQAQVARATNLIITTTKPDKWDRYLCDVYLTLAEGPELFLNNRLLELGHARLYEANSPKDWE